MIKLSCEERPVLSIRGLSKVYGEGCSQCTANPLRRIGNYCPVCGSIFALQNIDFDLYPGEILGIVGESGSGKSTLVKLFHFDQPESAGEYRLSDYEDGEVNLFDESIRRKRHIRNTLLSMVYQNPMLGLNMDFTSIANIAEKMISAGNRNVEFMNSVSERLLHKVNIPHYRMKEPPKNFSGGMQQRIQIAKALSNDPPILFLDEVTTGLDLSVQADVLDLIKTIRRDLGVSMIIVSHDLAVIRMLADRTLVMYMGEVVEEGLTDQILEDPQHPFTQKLVYSLL